jgi:hypothetical protein
LPARLQAKRRLAYFFLADDLRVDLLLRFEPDLRVVFLLADFFLADFFAGTFPPSRRASDKPIAIACLRLFTVLPERPLFNVPRLRSCIALFTFCWAFLPYLAMHTSMSMASSSLASARLGLQQARCPHFFNSAASDVLLKRNNAYGITAFHNA